MKFYLKIVSTNNVTYINFVDLKKERCVIPTKFIHNYEFWIDESLSPIPDSKITSFRFYNGVRHEYSDPPISLDFK